MVNQQTVKRITMLIMVISKPVKDVVPSVNNETIANFFPNTGTDDVTEKKQHDWLDIVVAFGTSINLI
jgi:hypothetical protein